MENPDSSSEEGSGVTPDPVTEKKVAQGLVNLARETGVSRERASTREFIADLAAVAAMVTALFSGISSGNDADKK